MAARIIVSYDDTANDRDAVALGRLFAGAGADAEPAYVRHAPGTDLSRELLKEHEAEELLRRGAVALGRPDARRHVILNPSTADGLRELVERERAEMVVFGSDYRTPPGSVTPGSSAQRLLAGGPAAVAVAPAGLRDRDGFALRRIGVLADGDDLAPGETAGSLAEAVDGEVVDARRPGVDLVVIGSRREAEPGQVLLTALAEYAIELSRAPVLVVARATAVRFGTPVLSSL